MRSLPCQEGADDQQVGRPGDFNVFPVSLGQTDGLSALFQYRGVIGKFWKVILCISFFDQGDPEGLRGLDQEEFVPVKRGPRVAWLTSGLTPSWMNTIPSSGITDNPFLTD